MKTNEERKVISAEEIINKKVSDLSIKWDIFSGGIFYDYSNPNSNFDFDGVRAMILRSVRLAGEVYEDENGIEVKCDCIHVVETPFDFCDFFYSDQDAYEEWVDCMFTPNDNIYSKAPYDCHFPSVKKLLAETQSKFNRICREVEDELQNHIKEGYIVTITNE